MRAIPYGDIADTIKTINGTGAHPSTKAAFEFLILTASRTCETRGARWEEIDLDGRVWEIPAARMKAGRPHRIPLSDRAVTILQGQQPKAAGLVFPSASGKEISDKTLAKLMRDRRMAGSPHGFRSAFSDYANDCTDYGTDAIEYALAHVTGNSTERSYKRTDLLPKRVELMADWAAFVTAENVIAFKKTG